MAIPIQIVREPLTLDEVEFDSMINVRPSQGNRSHSVEDAARRERILAIVSRLVRE